MDCGTEWTSPSLRAPARRLTRGRLAALLLVLVAGAGTASLALVGSSGRDGAGSLERPAQRTQGASVESIFHLLGPAAPTRPLAQRVNAGTTVAVARRGFAVKHGEGAISLVDAGASTRWTRFQSGFVRDRVFGKETILVTPQLTEQFYTVTKRQGRRTWSWSLRSPHAPRLLPNGSIAFAGIPVTIAPAEITSASGEVVTPAGATWKLAHSGDAWRLSLSFDDSELALPYLIDPAVHYPQTLYFSDADAPSISGTPSTPAANGGTIGTELLATTAQQNAHIAGGATARAAAGVQYSYTPTVKDVFSRASIALANCAAAGPAATNVWGAADGAGGTWWNNSSAASASLRCAVTQNTGGVFEMNANGASNAIVDTTANGIDIASTVTISANPGTSSNGWGYLLGGTRTGTMLRVEFLQAPGVVGGCTASSICLRVGSATATSNGGTYTNGTTGTQLAAGIPAANTPLKTRVSFIGSTLKVKYWTGSVEPDWMVTMDVSAVGVTCTSANGCAVGVFAYRVSTPNETTTFSNIQALAGDSANATALWPFQPGSLNSTTRLASLAGNNTDFTGKGWAIDPGTSANMGATGIPQTTYTIQAVTNVPSATFPYGDTRLVAQFFKATVDGSGNVTGGTLVTPVSAGSNTTLIAGGTALESSTNRRTATGSSTYSISATLPAMTLAAGQTLFVQLYRESKELLNAPTASDSAWQVLLNQQATGAVDSPNATKLTLGAAADDAAPTATVGTPAADGTRYGASTLPASFAGTATDANTISSVNVAIRESVTNNYLNAGGTAFDSATPNYLATGGTAASWTFATSGFAAALVDGRTYTITVQTTDQFGNTSSTAATRTFVYDAAAPAVTVSSPANGGSTNDTTPTLSGAAGDATGDASTVTVNVYAGTGTGGTLLQTHTPTRSGASWTLDATTLAQGTYTVQATQADTAGNTGTSTAITFVIDTAAPSVGATEPAAGTYSDTTYPSTTWTGTATDSPAGVASVEIQIEDDAGNFWQPLGGFAATSQWISTAVGSGWTWSGAPGVLDLTDGVYTVRLRASDNAGNSTASPTTFQFTYDSTEPQAGAVTSTKANGTYGAGEQIDITIAFDEAVTVTGTPRLQLNVTPTTRYATYVSGTGTSTLTFRYTVQTGDTSADLDYASTGALGLNGGTIRDAAGNNATLTLASPGAAGSLGNTKSIVISTGTAVSSIAGSATGTYKADDSILIDVTFTTTVTVTGTPTLTLNNGRTATYNGTGNNTNALQFAYTVQAGDDVAALDVSTINLPGGASIKNGSNDADLTIPSGQNLANNRTIKIDTSAPTVTDIKTSVIANYYNAGDVIPVTVHFSEPVTVAGTPTVTLNSAATPVAKTGASANQVTFSYTVGATDSTDVVGLGVDSINVDSGNTITDAAGNPANLAIPSGHNLFDTPNTPGVVIDNTPAAVASVSTTTPAGFYPVGTTIPITVTFTEPVNVDTTGGTPRLTLNSSGTTVATYVSAPNPSSTLTFSYTVAAGDNSPLSGLSVSAVQPNGGSILDRAGNTPTTFTIPNGQNLASARVIDTTAPEISQITSTTAAGFYRSGTVPITVKFAEEVVVTTSGGTPTLSLNLSSGTTKATYASGSGTDTLTFSYAIGATDNSPSGGLDVTAVNLEGGTIKDRATNAAPLTLPAQNLANTRPGLVVDTTVPQITEITTATAAGAYKQGSPTIQISVTFDEPVQATGTPKLNLTGGGTATYSGGPGASTTLTFGYTIGAGQNTSGLNVASFDLTGGSIADRATNVAPLTIPVGENLADNRPGIVVDTAAPTITGVTGTNGTYASGAVDLAVGFSEPVSVTGTPTLRLNVPRVAGVSAVFQPGAGTSLTFRYTIAGGDNVADLDYASTSALSLDGGTIVDAAGNAATLALAVPGTAGSLGAARNIAIDTRKPLAERATVSGDTITITFDEALGGTTAEADWAVTRNVADELPIDAAVAGRTVTLTLWSAVSIADVLSIDYSGSTLTDATGNGLAAFSIDVLHGADPGSGPTLASATTNAEGTQVALTFSAALDEGNGPTPAGAFAVAVGGEPRPTPASVTVSGSSVTLVLSGARVQYGEAVTVEYIHPVAQTLRGTTGADVTHFPPTPVTNAVPATPTDATPPAVSDARVNGSTLTLELTEPVTGSPAADEFTVLRNGAAVAVTSVSVSGSSVVLSLASAVAAGQTITVSYTAGANQIRDAAANPLGNLLLRAVTNQTAAPAPSTPAAPPVLASATPTDGSTLSAVSQISLTATSFVTWSNVAVRSPDGSSASLPTAAGRTATWGLAASADGLYTVSGLLTDQISGLTAPFTAHFTIFVPPPPNGGGSAGAPPVQATALPGEAGTLTASDGATTVTWPAAAFGGDAVIVEMQPQTGSEFQALPPNSVVVEVSAYLLSSRQPVTQLGGVMELIFRNAAPGVTPFVSNDGTAWREIPELSGTTLPAGQPDGWYRDSGNTLHVLTRHLTLFALAPQSAHTKLAMRIISANRAWTSRGFVAVHLDLTAPARIKSWFVSEETGRALPSTTQRTPTLRSGVSILRLRLPRLAPGPYRLQLQAEGSGQRAARTARLRVVKVRPSAVAPGAKPLGVVVVESPKQRQLSRLQAVLGSEFAVRTTVDSLLFGAVDPARTRTAAVVVDLDVVPLGRLAALQAVLPELRIVALASDPTSAVLARRAGATLVLAKPVSAWAVRQALRELLLAKP